MCVGQAGLERIEREGRREGEAADDEAAATAAAGEQDGPPRVFEREIGACLHVRAHFFLRLRRIQHIEEAP